MDVTQVVPNVNKKESMHSKWLISIIALIILLLSIRDIGGIEVNKYLFLIITGVVSFALPIDKVMYFIAFIMPLYVGLPGNYMTLIFLARFLLDYRKLRIKTTTFMFCMLAGSYAFIQSFITNHTAISELMFFPGMILVMFMFSLDVKIDKSNLILSYTTGVAALGLIMLIHTLQFCDFQDLLTSTNRLGSVLSNKSEMMINVDPNYYGLFCIAAMSLGIKFLNDDSAKQVGKARKAFMKILLGICIAVGLIGLSRTFLLVTIAWVLLYLLSVKNMKAFLISIGVLLSVAVLVICVIPGVWDALGNRFSDSSMATGNGRIELIIKYHELWSTEFFSILFGVGIFDCNVHCMPLQVLYGGGLVFCILFIAYMVALPVYKSLKNRSGALQKLLPLLVTLVMSCSVPALALINIMYPIVIAGMCMVQGEQS